MHPVAIPLRALYSHLDIPPFSCGAEEKKSVSTLASFLQGKCLRIPFSYSKREREKVKQHRERKERKENVELLISTHRE